MGKSNDVGEIDMSGTEAPSQHHHFCHPLDGRTDIYLVRHGQTEGNTKQLFIGSTDIPLDKLGERQALRLSQRFARLQIDAVISSPLLRARQTAERIAEQLNLPVEIHPGFTEIDFGDLEQHTIESFETGYPELALVHGDPESIGAAWLNGETRTAFNARVREALIDVLRSHGNQTVVVVSHGGVIGSVLSLVLGGMANDWAKFAVQNCSVTHLEVGACYTRIPLHNDHSHLDDVQLDLFSLTPEKSRRT
jgi:broad specificity phosphatase PhoE